MELTEDDISSFMEMWQRQFGEQLSREAAQGEAKRLIDFFLTLAEARLERDGKASAGHDTMRP